MSAPRCMARSLSVTLLGCLCLAGIGPGPACAQYVEVQVDTLTVRRAAELAITYHPSILGAAAGIRSASGAYRQSFSAYLPALSFSASGTHNEGVFVFTPTSGIRDQIYSIYAASFTLQQTIFDFGRTIGRVSASSDLVDAATGDDAANRNTLVMNVEVAYFGVMQAFQVVRVNEEAVDAAARHLAQTKAFYSVGRRPQLDVTKAEVDLANANVNLITARNDLRVARIQLENAIGVRLPATAVVQDTVPIRAAVPSLDSVRTVAMASRPELVAAHARLDASSSLITAAWTQHLPVLSATGTYTWSNFSVSPLFPRWVAGVTLSVPVFLGFAIDAQVQQARANEEIVQAGYEQLLQSVLLDVEQNYFSVQEAQERLGASVKLVEEAEQALVLAERQYAAGVGTQLDVTDAQLTRSNARITNIKALFDLNSSVVKLRRSMGVMP